MVSDITAVTAVEIIGPHQVTRLLDKRLEDKTFGEENISVDKVIYPISNFGSIGR